MSETVTIVMPVHNGARYLEECLTHLQGEVKSSAILMVDDASTDDSVKIARHFGIRILSEPAARAPYGARNDGWRASTSAVVVFTDVRCRPRLGWLAALQSALAESDVAIAGCPIEMVAEQPTTAERWAIKHQPLRGYLEHPFLPYVPTACLAVRRADLETLGGFNESRSGGDADFCWRAQRSGLGRVVWGDVGMWARPRSGLAEVLDQFGRYGASGWELQKEYGYRGDPPDRPQMLGSAWRAMQALWTGRSDVPVAVLDARRIIAYENRFRAERQSFLRGRS